MSVRVVATMLCERCKSDGSWWVPEILDGQVVGERLRECPECYGTGTVERNVSCRDCKNACIRGMRDGHETIYCAFVKARAPIDHACKAWEPRG